MGEFIGALAVVASVVYLAAQIRHNTRVVRSSTGDFVECVDSVILAERAE